MNKLHTYTMIILLFVVPANVIASDHFSNLSRENFLLLVQSDFASNNCQKAHQLMNLDRLNVEPEAAYYVASCIQQKPLNEIASSKAIELLKNSAKAGNASAAFQLSITYDNGYGVAVDPLKAVDWYRESKRLNKGALSNFEKIFLVEEGELKPATASNLYEILERQAKAGDSEAQYRYAQAIDQGLIEKLTLVDALSCYEKSAASDFPEANFTLGYLYCRGIGLEVNKVKSNHFFERSQRKINCP